MEKFDLIAQGDILLCKLTDQMSWILILELWLFWVVCSNDVVLFDGIKKNSLWFCFIWVQGALGNESFSQQSRAQIIFFLNSCI